MANTIYLRTQSDVLLEITKPRRLVSVGSADTLTSYPVATYDRYGLMKVLEDSGLTLENGVLQTTDGYFVKVAQGTENAGKFLYVNTQGTVGLTKFADMPTNTSQLVNDGEDGSSPFVTKKYMHDFLDSPEFYIPLAHIRTIFEED